MQACKCCSWTIQNRGLTEIIAQEVVANVLGGEFGNKSQKHFHSIKGNRCPQGVNQRHVIDIATVWKFYGKNANPLRRDAGFQRSVVSLPGASIPNLLMVKLFIVYFVKFVG